MSDHPSPPVPRAIAERDRRRLLTVLGEGQVRGFLGPGSVDAHIDHSLALSTAIDPPPRDAVDLGSGGGIPGLPLALGFDSSRWVLVEGGTTRASFLEYAIEKLELADRVSVVGERAEIVGRGELRGNFDLVVARSFAAPGVTAECAAPFLKPGGRLVVAEPPEHDPSRWPADGLDRLGMAVGLRMDRPVAAQVLTQVTLCPLTFPRRVGIPAKRPLF
jgi:16S rRNA (guanine527-N7)-methyltransferase